MTGDIIDYPSVYPCLQVNPAIAGIYKAFACTFLLVLLLALSQGLHADDYLSPGLPPDELAGLLGKTQAPLIVDVRNSAEYAIAHIPGAINIPHAELSERLEEIRGENGVLIYCFNGSRTREAEHILYENSIDNVYHLDGTFEKWLRGGYPVEKGGVKRNSW
jgi:rhodanese-related sulfurtransferase